MDKIKDTKHLTSFVVILLLLLFLLCVLLMCTTHELRVYSLCFYCDILLLNVSSPLLIDIKTDIIYQ